MLIFRICLFIQINWNLFSKLQSWCTLSESNLPFSLLLDAWICKQNVPYAYNRPGDFIWWSQIFSKHFYFLYRWVAIYLFRDVRSYLALLLSKCPHFLSILEIMQIIISQYLIFFLYFYYHQWILAWWCLVNSIVCVP